MAPLERIISEALGVEGDDVNSLPFELELTHLILNIDEFQMQSKEVLTSMIRACECWRSDGTL